MIAEELRIGNWVKWHKEKEPNETPWGEGHWMGVHAKNYSLEDCSPIPLTEDWLIRFGFEKLSQFEESETEEDYVWQTTTDKAPTIFLVNGIFHEDNYGVKLVYVHQLQNLYFSLTGKELTI